MINQNQWGQTRLIYLCSSKPSCRTCSGIQSNKVRPAGVHISLDTGRFGLHVLSRHYYFLQVSFAGMTMREKNQSSLTLRYPREFKQKVDQKQ